MNQRVSAILVVALLLSGGATYLVYSVAVARASETKAPSVQVIAAARTLEIGSLIKEGDVKVRPWAGTVPAGMATKAASLIGRGVIAPIYEGEAIMEARLAPAGAGGGLAATIPPGMRACAVRVNDIVGVAGFAVPGMRVDVLISGMAPSLQAAYGARVKTLLQNVQVLSAGQNFQKDAEGKPVAVQVVNLLVTPEQAEFLSLAASQTTIQLVLRNPLDHEISKTSGAALQYLFNSGKSQPSESEARPRLRPVSQASAPVPVPAPAPAPVVVEAPPAPPKEVPFVMEIISGPNKREQKFSGTTVK